MKITKNKDHVLFKNQNGEYHLSLEDYKKMGEKAAAEFAQKEIEKKLNSSSFDSKTITFDQARDLGFCDYGIKDFCSKIKIDHTKEQKISDIFDKLTVEAFLKYPSECRTLFGKDNIMNKFGGVKKFLSDNRTRKALNFVLNNKFLDDKTLHLLACDFAEHTLPNFEKKYPEDKRPHEAIKVKRLWIEEEYKKQA